MRTGRDQGSPILYGIPIKWRALGSRSGDAALADRIGFIADRFIDALSAAYRANNRVGIKQIRSHGRLAATAITIAITIAIHASSCTCKYRTSDRCYLSTDRSRSRVRRIDLLSVPSTRGLYNYAIMTTDLLLMRWFIYRRGLKNSPRLGDGRGKLQSRPHRHKRLSARNSTYGILAVVRFHRVILAKHPPGFACSRPLNRPAFRIEIMRLNLAYVNQRDKHPVFVECALKCALFAPVAFIRR